ncbi:hypothetical protein [Hymenobacter ruber]
MNTIQQRLIDINRQIMALMNKRDRLQAQHDRARSRARAKASQLPLASGLYDA